MIVANRIVEVRRDVSTMAKSNRNISIKGITAIIFVFSMMLSISGIGYLIFSGWLSSARQQTGMGQVELRRVGEEKPQLEPRPIRIRVGEGIQRFL